jgi:hypothetical protein
MQHEGRVVRCKLPFSRMILNREGKIFGGNWGEKPGRKMCEKSEGNAGTYQCRDMEREDRVKMSGLNRAWPKNRERRDLSSIAVKNRSALTS